jgi:hypothetical protein
VNLRETRVTIEKAQAFVQSYHRKHPNPVPIPIGHVAVESGGMTVGVAILARPVSPAIADAQTVEIARVATLEDHPNACSMLYGLARRLAWALGYYRVTTYTEESESGASLKAAGFVHVGVNRRPRPWNHSSRPNRTSWSAEPKVRWEIVRAEYDHDATFPTMPPWNEEKPSQPTLFDDSVA